MLCIASLLLLVHAILSDPVVLLNAKKTQNYVSREESVVSDEDMGLSSISGKAKQLHVWVLSA
jgi:hypothetical protein